MLKLNPDKTEIMVVSTRANAKKQLFKSVECANAIVEPCNVVKNLGVMFDCCLNMDRQVTAVCKSVNYHLRNLWRIRKYLDKESAKTIVHAMVSARLDYGNALLYGLPKLYLNKLQRLQNTAARIVSMSPKNCHITPILFDLHWLPVERRIQYKILH